MVRLVRRRFGETVAAISAPVLARITEPTVLEDLGEALLDCADGGRGWRRWRIGRADGSTALLSENFTPREGVKARGAAQRVPGLVFRHSRVSANSVTAEKEGYPLSRV
ncbi:MAG: hypothetical protein IPL59_14105 [Candidatus Competibacteraceae bacterium]|nr:hypothetical protein [Candidatus Competibacteraceae bacterium]